MFSPDDTVGGRYRILREIGRGGFGQVLLAEELERAAERDGYGNLSLDLGPPLVLRQVALKTFERRPRLGRNVREELRALCRLSHPNIVSVYDYNLNAPSYIAMEYVAGRDLQSWLDESGPLSLGDALAVARQVGGALAHAHAAGVLHRDVKPANVIVGEDLSAKLVDFGLARRAESLSEPNSRWGTPGFVAPELVDPDRFRVPIGVPADVYGLGCLLHALLVGHSPFAGESPAQTLRNQLRDQSVDDGRLPPPVRGLVQRAIALAPDDRFPSVPAFLEAQHRVEIALTGPPPLSTDEPDRIDLVDAQVLRCEPFDHPRRGRGLRYELAPPGSTSALRGFVYEGPSASPTRPLYETLSELPAGSELSLYDCVPFESSTKGRFVTADGQTLGIIDPHFLVSVTEVVRCQGIRARDCATRAFVDLRDDRGVSRPLVLGRILHDLFDALAEDHAAPSDFATHFERAFARSRIDAVAAGLTDADVAPLKQEVDGAYQWLKRFMSRQVEGVGRSAEVTRFSGRYGLEGRIDLALLGDERLEIVELKSGRHQNPEHEAQLRCYTLLWDDAALSLKRQVRGRLLYCRGGLEKTIRRQDHQVDRRALQTRNLIVKAHRALARGQLDQAMPHHRQWPERCNDAPCRFRAKSCAEQCANIGLGEWRDARTATTGQGPWRGVPAELVEAARAHYRHFVQLIELEYAAQSRQQGEFTRPLGLAQRLSDRDALGDASLVEWDTGLKAIRLSVAGARRLIPGRDVVVHRGDPDLHACLTGRVETVLPDGLVVHTEAAGMCAELPRDGWVIEPLPARIGRRESHRALYRLLTLRDPERLRSLLHGSAEEPARAGAPVVTASDDGGIPLNAIQESAVALALSETRRPVLIHGPPGTGKTTVIGSLVQRLVAQGQRVLVAAGTNTAVDNVIAQLLERDVDFLRLGPLTARSGLRRLTSPDRLARRIERTLAHNEPSLNAIAERLRTVPVVAGTAHRCIRSPAVAALRRLLADDGGEPSSAPFDVAVIDEATQITEPLSLGVALAARRVVLVGDAQQLPPVINADEARSAYWSDERDPLRHELGLKGLDHTLFERLQGRAPEVRLEVQYRMSREVQELSNRLYYENRLTPHESVATRRLALDPKQLAALPEVARRRLSPDRPVVWETLGAGVTGRRNDAEADAVAETLAALADAWPGSLRDVGVISPFRAQCHAIYRSVADRLGADRAAAVEIDTVERFQGREKEVMLVSLVVSTWSDFVMDDRRLNVAFTRARSKLIVFGPAQLLYRYERGLSA